MGRSKFPGKPSKHVNRTRINVLSTVVNTTVVGDSNPTVVTVEAGDDSKKVESVEQNEDSNKAVGTSRRLTRKDRKKRVSITGKHTPIKRTILLTSVNSPLNSSARLTRSKVARRPVRGFNNIRKLAKSKLSISPKKESSNNLVGKFVLPSRSVHSSRVIKPNKRFISIDQNETRVVKKRVINKRINIKNEEKPSETPTEQPATSNGKVVLRQARLQIHSNITLGPEGPFSSNNSAVTTIPSPVTCGVCGAARFYRFIKQARKFNILCCESCRKFISKVIQRANNKNVTSPLNCHKGQGLCHVPPVVRSQHWKYNRTAYNARCPACWLKICLRSFQMPMALKSSLFQLLPKNMQTNESLFTTSLPLLTWQSNVENNKIEVKPPETSLRQRPVRQKPVKKEEKPPPPPANDIKRQKIDLKGPRVKHVCRSASIVLGQTLATFPAEKKIEIVEKVEKDAEVVKCEIKIASKCDVESILAEKSNDVKIADIQPSLDKEIIAVKNKDILIVKNRDIVTVKNKDVTVKKDAAVKNKDIVTVKNKDVVIVKNKDVTVKNKEVVTVKNKDIVIAKNKDLLTVKNKDVAVKNKDVVAVKVKEVAAVKNKEVVTVKNKDVTTKSKDVISALLTTSKKDKLKNPVSMLPFEVTKLCITKKTKKIATQMENPNLIDIDFWENYDPDEVICNGFSITSSTEFPMQAICFLCGSAGKETLLHCCICCEPYHPYCLEQVPPNLTSDQKYTWVCPKCTTCSACGEADRQKINCQKCHKAYHPQCFNTKWRTDDRPTVCSNCLRCKSCGTDNITKFVGNLALCLLCFKLRNRGNFCPLCQCCYDDNDFDTKMMECGKCNKWVHAKCEGLSDEQYQILSILPESVEFLCCLCSNQTTPYWRKAVQSELRSCFNSILRLLSKNRIARDMLKLSPFKLFSPITKNLNSARRLQFIEDDSNSAKDINSSLENDLEQVNAIFKNKIDFGDSFNSSLNDSKLPISPSMIEIKNKINCNEYFTLRDFNEGMEQALKSTLSDELSNIYRSILKKVFPWFDPNLKDDLSKTICGTERIEKNDDEKKYEQFEVCDSNKNDSRVCNLCKGIGDGLPDKEARLLYYGQNDWVHANCALWSSEVYEEIDGSLQNVQGAVSRGRSIRCAFCKQKGASVGCCLKGCYETYHFPCAQKAECHFIVDKTIYCKLHDISEKLNIVTNSREFEIRRSVYIELDNKKRRHCEPNMVNFMVGSLSVMKLGKVIPSVSDTIDAIIPIGYVCSRLFWSTTEPWKLIPYKITTSILNTNSHIYVDKNFTVDHTLPKHVVDKKLREVYLWQRDDKDKNELEDFEEFGEQQAPADNILSPELTDAILEELPHDLLDGISVQEMLMGYEELMNMDFKNSEINCNDNLSLNMNNDKIEDCDENKGSRELKRSKSEVYQKIEDKMKPRNTQRSCSLTWLQLDNTLAPAIKKRKRDANMFMQLLQVDGAYDSSGSECGSPTHESEDVWTPDVYEEPVTCEKCQCTYRTNASYKRHLESCDAMFTSESEPETETLVAIENPDSEVITSYESFSSYQTTQNQIQSTVMNTQTIMAESKMQDNAGSIYYNYQPVKQLMQPQNIININQPITLNQNADNHLLNQFCVNQQNVCVNHPNIISVDKNSSIIMDNQVLNQMNPINIDMQQQPVTIQSVPYTPEVINLGQQNQAVTIDAKMLAPNLINIPQNNIYRPIIAQNKGRARPRIVAKRTRMPGNTNTIVLPQNSNVILQHIPSNSFPFVDAFQQNTGQNVQYVATIAPQTIQPQAQLVQLPENNFLSLVPNVQPTMIIQQPRVDTGQLIVDSNGAMVWATQPVQPVYYGFETIVQNTVMQSQQFLPTTVPGILQTTNSSYSATTQVFQTSKLEPVIDGSSYVLVNSNQIVNQPTTVQVPQIQTSIAQTMTPSNQMQNKVNYQIETQPIQQQPQPAPRPHPHPIQQSIQQPLKPVQIVTTINPTTNSITLPVAPFVSEQGIPTNIVTPTPKPTLTQCRPMSRVLPMQTVVQQKKLEKPSKEATKHIDKIIVRTERPKITLISNQTIKPANPLPPPPKQPKLEPVIKKEEIKRQEKVIIKADIPETKEDKIVIKKDIPEVLKMNKQVASLKPIKTKPSLPSVDKENAIVPPITIEEPVKPKLTIRAPHNNTSVFYKIESADGVDYSNTSLPQIWRKVFNDVQAARLAHNLPPLPEIALRTINDLDILGLRTNGMKYLLEQLPEAVKCKTYKPVFHKPRDNFQFEEDDDEENTKRCIPYIHKREKYDMFRWLSSKHRTLLKYYVDPAIQKNLSSSLPMVTRFKALKLISKYSVGVYRSEIHGRGLFSLRDVEGSEMVIEYAGEVIRSVLTDKREKYYNSKGIGCYMFRIDDNRVVDATMKGNAARFINHSCDPNCFSKVVDILGSKHIIIFALRKIICGEELTYDYKFPFEEDKIPCTCGTKRCRKFLN